ncbi:MAG: adenylyl-sulfate kinase [Ilumatobacteraceae bacterium]
MVPDLDQLRLVTCGSVDDGKSTLLGRLLFETHQIYEDQLAALERDSRVSGTTGGGLDLALLTDGLAAEREQGITIDVAYRFVTTAHRRLVIADSPGHEQYTRNMVTAASTADVAVLLIDARHGVLTQTRRHRLITHLLGVEHVVLAVNKMDLVDWSEDRFNEIVRDYEAFSDGLDGRSTTAIPMSALLGDNVVAGSEHLNWYDGPTLLEHLDGIDASARSGTGLRLPVQTVLRPDSGFRGYAGRVVSGSIEAGANVRILPSGVTTTVDRIVVMGADGADVDLASADAGDSVTVCLATEVDCSRGDVITSADDPAEVADQFQIDVVWMHESPMLPGRPYLARIGTSTVGATLSSPRWRVDVNSGEHLAADTLELNDIGVCNLSLDRAVPFDSYSENRGTGSLIIVDRYTGDTVGAGMIRYALRRSSNIHWQATTVDAEAREALMGHRSAVVWFTGLSGSGKSTIANEVERRLHARGVHTFLLDGDNVRHGLNRDLGFTDADRVENIRRIVEVASLMADAGLVVLTSFISPFRAERALARDRIGDRFIEVHVDVPLAVAEERDPKGLYAKARAGDLANFTGIDSPYEAPEEPNLVIDTSALTVEQAADAVLEVLDARLERG